MTPLETILREVIQREGPLSLEAFQHQALFHPEYGYYRTQEALGLSGDFMTAPEVSGLFGDVLGAFCLYEWETVLGSPASFSLLELGPGRGTLMADVLRVGRLRPAFLEGVQVTFLEINPLLKKQQEEKLASCGVFYQWAETLDNFHDLPGPFIILANEFLDVFPVEQWVQLSDGSWKERHVTWKDGQFSFLPGGHFSHVREKSPQREALFCQLLALLKSKGGVLWVADYGYRSSSAGDSLQGLHQQKLSHPLEHIGLTDLSSHVDFGRLAELAQGFACDGPMTQRDFLLNHGLDARVEFLRTRSSVAEKATLEAGYMRLTHPLQMGELFKVLVVRP